MDMFFAAVAMRDDPSLIGKPIAVGHCAFESLASVLAALREAAHLHVPAGWRHGHDLNSQL